MNVRAKKPFTDILEFCTRVDLRTVNKRVIESLICAGAFDTLPGSRAKKYQDLAKIMETAAEKKKEQQTGQTSLFGQLLAKNSSNTDTSNYQFSPCTEWTDKEKLEREKEVTGFYVSEHPLGMYQKQLKWFDFKPFAIVPADESGIEPVILGCGLLKTRRDIVTKKGDRMAFVQLEELNGGSAELVIFPKLFKAVEPWLGSHQVFVVKGNLDLTSDKICKIKAETLVPIELIFEHWPHIQGITMNLPESFNEELLQKIREALVPGNIGLTISFVENSKSLVIETKEKIAASADMFTRLAEHSIDVHVTL